MSFFVMILELTKYPPTCTPHTSKPVVLGRRKCYKVKQQKMSLQSLCRTVNICADALIQGKMFNTWLLVMSFCVNVCVLSVTEARNGCCLGGFPCLSCPSGISAVCLQLCAVLRLQMRPELADLIPVPAHCYVCSLQASLLCPSLWHCCCLTSLLSPWTAYGWEPSHLSSHPCSPITGTAGVSSTALSFSKRLFQSLASYNGQHLQHRLTPDPSWSLAVLLPCVPGCLRCRSSETWPCSPVQPQTYGGLPAGVVLATAELRNRFVRHRQHPAGLRVAVLPVTPSGTARSVPRVPHCRPCCPPRPRLPAGLPRGPSVEHP